jgi:AbrB family looped-hinge helix DNA binding protein
LRTVLVSPKFQVVIPRENREQSNITVGQRLQMISFDDRIELVPVRKMKSTRGFLKGFNYSFSRDEEDRV